eukprot:gene10521-biopygen3304
MGDAAHGWRLARRWPGAFRGVTRHWRWRGAGMACMMSSTAQWLRPAAAAEPPCVCACLSGRGWRRSGPVQEMVPIHWHSLAQITGTSECITVPANASELTTSPRSRPGLVRSGLGPIWSGPVHSGPPVSVQSGKAWPQSGPVGSGLVSVLVSSTLGTPEAWCGSVRARVYACLCVYARMPARAHARLRTHRTHGNSFCKHQHCWEMRPWLWGEDQTPVTPREHSGSDHDNVAFCLPLHPGSE